MSPHAPACVCKPCCDARLSAQPAPVSLDPAKDAIRRVRATGDRVHDKAEQAAERAAERRERRKQRGGRWGLGVWF